MDFIGPVSLFSQYYFHKGLSLTKSSESNEYAQTPFQLYVLLWQSEETQDL